MLAGFAPRLSTQSSGKPDRPEALQKRVGASEKTARVPRGGSGEPDERNLDPDPECGEIQYNHYKSKQIHSHHQSNCDVHRQNARQPKELGFFDPDENRVTEFDQAD